MMKRENIIKLSAFVLLFLMSSCFRDGENLDECIRNMRIELRWMQVEALDKNEQVNIKTMPVGFGTTSELKSDIYGVDVDLLTGEYNIVGWENYSNVNLDIENKTVALQTSTDGSLLNPDLFSAGSTTAEVTLSQTNQIIPLPMYRQVRPLIIKINLIGEGYTLVNGVNGTLTGIALKRGLEYGFPPVNGLNRPTVIQSGSMPYLFEQTNDEGAGVWYTGTKNLIGIDGSAEQQLNLTVSFSGDNGSSDYKFDVTGQLAEYHTKDVDEPWYIIITLELGIDLNISVVDWIAGSESWIIAH